MMVQELHGESLHAKAEFLWRNFLDGYLLGRFCRFFRDPLIALLRTVSKRT
jgi:hypothetical protein